MFNRELAKRFISDYNLPIPFIGEELFFYHIDLYEDDYGSKTKYQELLELIQARYNGNCNDFLEDYYNVRERIINSVLENDAYQRFNTMDMSMFSVKLPISSNNIYKQENVGKFFISIDLKKANFQTLRRIDKDILFGVDTYEDFIGLYSDLDYIKNSKYTRQVVFGKLNPSRHITAEKYFISQLYGRTLELKPSLNGKAVSLSSDEIIFEVPFSLYNDKLTCFALRKDIEAVCKELGFEVHVSFFHLRGFLLNAEKMGKTLTPFYYKEHFCTEANFKLKCVPLNYHAIAYKLFKGMELKEEDYHFNYEGLDAILSEEFTLEEIKGL